jgi:ABC-type nickel/cobalt efflux system permease component RcnA
MEIYSTIIKYITLWQYELNKLISLNIRDINDENYLSIYGFIIGIAFLYGLIHAAGPGHGKALVALYFTKGKSDYKEAFKLGYLISIIHAISALVVTFGIYFILKTMFRQNFNQFSNTAMGISAVMIIGVGLFLIYSAVKEKYKPCHNEQIDTNKSKYAVALGVGIVPCPGVMTIVLFCIMLKKFTLGILAAIAMSIGMGLTISIVGILSVLFANKTDKFVNSKGYILEAISGVFIVILGIFMFTVTIK